MNGSGGHAVTDATTRSGSQVERPSSVAEAAACLRDTSGSVLFRGAGTSLDWGGTVVETDLTLDTGALSGVLDHTAADMTAAVKAGTPLAVLQDELAGHGQWLALDPPTQGAGATLGGLLSAGDSGPSRLRYGNLRDLVIGVTLVLADGTVARSGGHVIKNVAGYDLAKLVHGSLGSLALIAEVVVRLHPRPVEQVTTAGRADARQAAAAAGAIAASALEPTAVEWVQDDDDGGRLLVRSVGSPVAVAAAVAQLRALLAGVGVAASRCPPEEASQLWAAHERAVTGDDGDTVLRISTLPTDLAGTAEHASRCASAAGLTFRLVSSAALGVHTVRLSGDDPQAVAAGVSEVRQHVLDRGGSVLLRRRPADVDARVDPLGPPPSSVELLRRVKAQFDPTGRCAPGRFKPWY